MPDNNRRISLSYSREDTADIRRIENALLAAGFETVIDRVSVRDESFEQALERELEGAQCVIVFWSASAAQSRFAQRGIRTAIRAWSSGRLLLAALDDTTLPVGLRDISPISVRSASGSGIKELIERTEAVVAASRIYPLLSGPPATVEFSPAFYRKGNGRVWIVSIAVLAAFALFLCLISLGGSIARFLATKFNALSGQSGPPESPLELPPKLAPPDATEMWLLIVFGALFVGVLIGLGAAWARGLRTRRTSETFPIATLTARTAEHDPHVFVSYSHQDAGIVDGLVKEIEG
jgi:TIR domain